MAKTPSLSDLTSLTNEASAISAINNNNDTIVTAFANTLSRDGSTPNTMTANLDMNSNYIINSPDPTSSTHLVTKSYADENYGAAAVAAALAAQTAAEVAAAQADADVVLTHADVITTAANVVAAAAELGKNSATSTTSLSIAVATKIFTIQLGKAFTAGQFVLVTSDAAPTTDFMFGSVASYSGTTLTVAVIAIGGSGTHADWSITVSGARGAQGDTGAPGAGTGDMLAANNLSDLANKTTARSNLGVAIGSNVQAFDATLASLSSLGTASDKLAYTTDVDTWAETALTTAGRALIDDADAATMRATLGVVIGTDVGYATIPQNSKSAAYTTVLGDSGKHIFHPGADTTARTFTIDSNANVAYSIGTAITFINQHSAGVLTIAITSDTMRLAGTGTTGSRTLAADGMATAIKIDTTEWIISGTGLT